MFQYQAQKHESDETGVHVLLQKHLLLPLVSGLAFVVWSVVREDVKFQPAASNVFTSCGTAACLHTILDWDLVNNCNFHLEAHLQ